MRLLTQLLVPILVAGAVSADTAGFLPPTPSPTVAQTSASGGGFRIHTQHLPWSREKETRHREVVI